MYDQAYNKKLHLKFEPQQHDAAVSIIEAIKGLFRKKPFKELALETLRKSFL